MIRGAISVQLTADGLREEEFTKSHLVVSHEVTHNRSPQNIKASPGEPLRTIEQLLDDGQSNRIRIAGT